MKKLILLFTLACTITFTQAQTTKDLEPFTKVLIKGNLEVELIPAAQYSMEVERGEEQRLEITQEDGQLTIRHQELYKYKSYRDFPIRVKLMINELWNLDIRAGAVVTSTASIGGIRLDIHLGSGAKLKTDLQYEKVDVDIAEGAEAKLSGRVGRFTAIAGSGAQLLASDLDSEDSRIRANTGAVAHISAFKSLDAKANTGASIFYSGNPEEVVIQEELWGNVAKN